MFDTKSASNLSYLQNQGRAKYFHTVGPARRDSVRDEHRSAFSPRTVAFSYTLGLNLQSLAKLSAVDVFRVHLSVHSR